MINGDAINGAAIDGISGGVTCLLSADTVIGDVAGVAYSDFTSLLTGRETEYYTMDLIVDGDLVRVPISSWQGTLNAGRSGYLQCVVPAAEDWVTPITEATGFIIYRQLQVNGGVIEYEMARATKTASNPPVFYQTPSKYTCTLPGVSDAYPASEDPDEMYDRTLQNVRSITIGAGGVRVRAGIDFLLRPGQRAFIGETPFVVSYINYYGLLRGSYMDVGERA